MNKRTTFYILAAFIFAGTSLTVGAVQEGIGRLNLADAAELLVQTEFKFPSSAAKLSESEDGLPQPDDAQFAKQAAKFISQHPIPSAGQAKTGLWDLRRTSSRQIKCLAYLASNHRQDRRQVAELCIEQAMRMQWTLPIRMGHRGRIDRTFYAATAGLSLTGGLLRSRAETGSLVHEVATQWLRTALGQLATHSPKQDKPLKKAAMELIGDVGEEPGLRNLHGSDEDFFLQLDLARPDMQEVAKHVRTRDWDKAKQAYVDALAKRFSKDSGWPDINFWKKELDLIEADEMCRNIFTIRAHMYLRHDFGKTVDWTKVLNNDVESRVWMNHHVIITTLANAYQQTGDDKYVTHLCRLFNSWYETSPVPFERTGAQWRTLEVGARPALRWDVALTGLSEHPTFQREVLFNMARSMLDHGRYLSMYATGGGNWLQVESSGLACVALLFPEFKLSPLFYEVAINRLVWINANAFLPDGFQFECSPGYHRFPLLTMASTLQFANFLNAPVSENLLKQYQAGLNVLQHIAYPDMTLPMLSDYNPLRQSVVEIFGTGADIFGRKDFLWFATGGRQGKPPEQTSHDFTHAGYCVMRDKWGPHGQMLIFDAGYIGAGHYHEDKLNFVYYAGGRELIGDPGIYSYKQDKFEPYWRGSWSHNTIVIDGLSQHRSLGPREKIPDSDRRFVIGDGFDFAVGWYKHAYAPRGSQRWKVKPASREPVRNLQHQRCIFYMKGKYAVICDRVMGRGKHQVDIIFRPAPVIIGQGINKKSRAVKLDITPKGVVITKEAQHANVAIIPAQGNEFEVLDLIGCKDPVRGWFALYAITPSHDIVYRCSTELPKHFETVVQPLPPGEAEHLKVQSRQVDCKEGKMCAAVKCGNDLLLISYDGPAEMTCEDIKFVGTALLLKFDKSSRADKAYMVDAKLLTIGGKQIFSTDIQKPAVSLHLR